MQIEKTIIIIFIAWICLKEIKFFEFLQETNRKELKTRKKGVTLPGHDVTLQWLLSFSKSFM